jgi:energy-coupling factor transport system permease protein
MDLFLYVDRGTWLHRRDPRVKLLALLGLFVVALVINSPLRFLLLIAALVLFLTLGGALRNLSKMMPLLLLLFLSSSVLWTLFTRGERILYRWGGLQISAEGLVHGISMGLRLDTLVMAGLLFLSTTSIEEFTWSLSRLGVPFPIAFALSTAFRLVPTFLGTGATVVEAQKSRGLDLEGGHVIARVRKHIPLLIPIFVSAMRSADLLAMALESKGFGAHRRRTFYLESRLRPADYALVVGVALVLAVAWVF